MGNSTTIVTSVLGLVLVFLVCSATAEWPRRRLPLLVRRPHLTKVWQNVAAPAAVSIRGISLQRLPCPKGEGYYAYPSDCTMFYRCVDFEGSNTIFSRYAFRCPNGTVFLPGKDVCVPGVCELAPIDPSRPPTPSEGPSFPVEVAIPTPIPGVTPPSVVTSGPTSETPTLVPVEVIVTSVPPPVDTLGSSGSSAPEEGSPAPEGGSSGGEEESPVTKDPEPATESHGTETETGSSASSGALPPAGETGTSTGSGSTGETTGQDCGSNVYIQHKKFCNLYHPCNDEKTTYACPSGAVFDSARSMCRIGARDEPLCEGKAIAYPFYYYRYRGERPFYGLSDAEDHLPQALRAPLNTNTHPKPHRWSPIRVEPISPFDFLDEVDSQPFKSYL